MTLKQVGSNMTVLSIGNNEVLFSYATPVAAFISGQGYVKTDKFYSRTTSKHIRVWLDSREATVVPQATIDALVNEERRP